MAKFNLPPISPLIGSNIRTFFKTLSYGRISSKYYLKLVLSFIIMLIGYPFRKYESLQYSLSVKYRKKVSDPVFIIGHWRSGTTYLHNILTRDKRFGYITTYQSVFPNNLIAQFIFRIFMKARMPETRPGDNVKLRVNYPQEDEFALSNMNPYTYYQFMYMPENYRFFYDKFIRLYHDRSIENRWMKDYDKLIKKALHNTGGQIPILKNPCNTGRIPTLLNLYPEARIIHIVRNPIIIFLSARKFFIELLPTLWFHEVDREFIENMIIDVYEWMMKDFLEFRDKIQEQDFLEIKYEEFIENPLTYMEQIYKKFGLDGYQDVLPVFQSYVEDTAGYKKNKYTFLEKSIYDKIESRWAFAFEAWNYEVPDFIEIKNEKAMHSE